MKIRLLRDCSFVIVDHLDANEDPVEVDEDFKKGDILDGDEEDDRGDSINFQFANGAMLYGIKKEVYEVIEKD